MKRVIINEIDIAQIFVFSFEIKKKSKSKKIIMFGSWVKIPTQLTNNKRLMRLISIVFPTL